MATREFDLSSVRLHSEEAIAMLAAASRKVIEAISPLEVVADAARRFAEQASRGESENPEEYATSFLALRNALDELGGTE